MSKPCGVREGSNDTERYIDELRSDDSEFVRTAMGLYNQERLIERCERLAAKQRAVEL